MHFNIILAPTPRLPSGLICLGFWLNFCMGFLLLLCVPYTPSISFSAICSLRYCLVSGIVCEFRTCLSVSLFLPLSSLNVRDTLIYVESLAGIQEAKLIGDNHGWIQLCNLIVFVSALLLSLSYVAATSGTSLRPLYFLNCRATLDKLNVIPEKLG
jgi:hypothetical protein